MASFGKSSVAGGADKTPKLAGQVYTDGLAGNPLGSAATTTASATATLTTTGTDVTDGDIVTINDVTYRFKTTMAQANDVQKGAGSSDTSLDNLVAAVNQSGTPGTEYFAGTVAPASVTAGARTGTGATGSVVFTASPGVEGNDFVCTKTAVTLTWANPTFIGGNSWDPTDLDDRAALKRAYPGYFV